LAVVGGVGDDRWQRSLRRRRHARTAARPAFSNAGTQDNLDALYELLDDKFLVKTTDEWMLLEAHDMICARARLPELIQTAGARQRIRAHRRAPLNGPTQIVSFRGSSADPAHAALQRRTGGSTPRSFLSLGYTSGADRRSSATPAPSGRTTNYNHE
jgi:crotonobetainyl-CoA:carnitine CoA-transferase CaiB-like acyl-CoA transferase